VRDGNLNAAEAGKHLAGRGLRCPERGLLVWFAVAPSGEAENGKGSLSRQSKEKRGRRLWLPVRRRQRVDKSSVSLAVCGTICGVGF